MTTRKLDGILKDLFEVVTAELGLPGDARSKSVVNEVALRYREVPGAGLWTGFATAPTVTFQTGSTGLGTMVMEFQAERTLGSAPNPLTRLTFVGVAEHTFFAEGFAHLGNRRSRRQRLIELTRSERLESVRRTCGPLEEAAQALRHYRIEFAAHGAYDVLCLELRTDLIPPVEEGEPLVGLNPRASEFLRNHATRQTLRLDPAEEHRDATQAARQCRVPFDTVRAKITHLQQRFGGLQYWSPSWSFEEIIGFAPALDLDDEDTEPMLNLIEHTAAHPFGVWATLDGAVDFMFPGEHVGKYVRVFDRIEAIIESDALMAECAEWIEVAQGGGDTINRMEGKVSVLSRIDEASGHTESWWEGAASGFICRGPWQRSSNRASSPSGWSGLGTRARRKRREPSPNGNSANGWDPGKGPTHSCSHTICRNCAASVRPTGAWPVRRRAWLPRRRPEG